MRAGLTLDQLNLQAGDQIVVPERGGGIMGSVGVIVGLAGTLSFVFFRIFN